MFTIVGAAAVGVPTGKGAKELRQRNRCGQEQNGVSHQPQIDDLKRAQPGATKQLETAVEAL
jgi:hypothetical protein